MRRYAKTIDDLGFDELDSRFKQKSHRVLGGRADELVYQHATGIVPTHYTLIMLSDSLIWRYVSHTYELFPRLGSCFFDHIIFLKNLSTNIPYTVHTYASKRIAKNMCAKDYKSFSRNRKMWRSFIQTW